MRPIGVFAGIYRCWARARRPVAEKWEREHDRPFFAAKEGNSALNTVWDQAFRAERAVAQGKSAAAVLLDLRAFYEHFDHDLLGERAADTNFPRKVARLALAAYPRLITQEGRLGQPVLPKRGVMAGCGFATTWVKI